MASFHRSVDLPVTVLRPFNTFGPFQSARAIVPTMVSQALASSTLRLGSLHRRRDLTYVDDTAVGFGAGDRTVGRTLQPGTGVDVSIGDLAALVGEALGKERAVEPDPERVRPPKSEVERQIPSPALAEGLTGWTPSVSLAQGLERTIAWIERHADRYRVDECAV
jgi:nucleoside-diphosphate-sugar epimerase